MDPGLTRLSVLVMGTICCMCVLGTVALAAMGERPPESLGTIGGAAIGAIVGILLPTGRTLPVDSEKTRSSPSAT